MNNYIILNKKELTQEIIADLKNYSKNTKNKYIEDTIDTLVAITLKGDTEEYYILKWNEGEEPASLPKKYRTNNQNNKEKIHTNQEMLVYLETEKKENDEDINKK